MTASEVRSTVTSQESAASEPTPTGRRPEMISFLGEQITKVPRPRTSAAIQSTNDRTQENDK